MQYFEHAPGGLSFNFFGVPTTIRPSSWLVLLILGSGTNASGLDLVPTLTFVVAGMLCLLVHEYGHAFSCRALGGGPTSVEIASLGGTTTCAYPPSTRIGYILMTLAGPGASLLLGVAAAVIMSLQLGTSAMETVFFAMTIPLPFDLPDHMVAWSYGPVWHAINESSMSEFTVYFYLNIYLVSVWWSLFNLLPIFPMDGGKTLYMATNNQRLTGAIGIAISLFIAYWCLQQGMIFNLLICAWLLWINWQYMRLSR